MFSYFSPQKQFERFEKKFQKVLTTNDSQKPISLFCKELTYLLGKKESELLSQLFLSYLTKIDDTTALRKKLSSNSLREAVELLVKENKPEPTILQIYDTFRFHTEAIDFLAKRGRANVILSRVTTDENVDKELLHTAIQCWEKYNGDIRKSPTICNGLNNIAKFAIESIPKHPQAREVIGEFKDAAELYEEKDDVDDAARCYEYAESYSDALRIYQNLYELHKKPTDREGISRAYEALGDAEKALKYVVKPERKVHLLIRLEQFPEAEKYAAGLEEPREKYFELIKEGARTCIDAKSRTYDFVEAIKLIESAKYTSSKKEEILQLGRQHFDNKLASASSEDEMNSIYKSRAELEESAGHFEEAAQIAADILHDAQYASFLYKKANRFDLAITVLEGDLEKAPEDEAKILEVAESHEEGGSVLEAAKHYESVRNYEKAFELYESSQLFDKALECYLQTSNPLQNKLIDLYRKVGEYEKIIALYLKSGTFRDLEEALSISKTYNLPTHKRLIQEQIDKLVSGNEEDLTRCFTQAKNENLARYSSIFGIDFGTTNSVVAIFNRTSKQVEIVQSPHGAEFEPSYFGVDDQHHSIFGEKARMRYLTHPECVVSRVKRSLGGRESWSLGGGKYRSEQVIAEILQHLRLNAEQYMKSQVEKRFCEIVQNSGNLKFPDGMLHEFIDKQALSFSMKDVVLTVPAYFNDNQKRAMRDSAEIAGLHIKRLLHEPTAAALAYGYQQSYSGHLAVIDLGGGTLDISILDVAEEKIYEVQSVGGDTLLGGSDIDRELIRHVIRNIKANLGVDIREETHSQEIARLRDACENMKIQLSSVAQYTMELQHFLNKPLYTFTLTQAELEELSQPILDRIRNTVEKTIRDSNSTLNCFILVGNATRMPIVGELMNTIIQARCLRDINPGTVVATGAALQGAVLTGDLKDALILDVVPHSLGIVIRKRDSSSREREMSFLIERNSTIPICKTSTYTTVKDDQKVVAIEIYQGESHIPQRNHRLGNFSLGGINPAPAGTKQIEVKFDIGADCILTVTAVDQETRNAQSVTITDTTILSPEVKERWGQEFKNKEHATTLKEQIGEVRREIEKSISSYNNRISSTEQAIQEFFELFTNITKNTQNYNPTIEQTRRIQEMFVEKDTFSYGVPRTYVDRFTSTMINVTQTESKHLDFSSPNIVSTLQERINILSHYQEDLNNLISSIGEDVTSVITEWQKVLSAVEPNLGQMAPLEVAKYHLLSGRIEDAKQVLESGITSQEGLSEKGVELLLKCYIRFGLRDDYTNTLQRFGNLIGITTPDFNHLNTYLKTVNDSIVLIHGTSQKRGSFSGSGFSIAPNLIVTNRHVVEEIETSDLRIIGKEQTYSVEEIELDPINDIAILKIAGKLKPLRLGEFNFVEPGERVIAIAFPAPGSASHSENIYISDGRVNSIRKIEMSPERVIFMDSKIGQGMSGGPLFNGFGEVIGIVTMHYGKMTQPIALPIHLVKKYRMKYQIS